MAKPKKVMCINNEYNWIAIGDVFEVLGENDDFYLLLTEMEDSEPKYYRKIHFITTK